MDLDKGYVKISVCYCACFSDGAGGKGLKAILEEGMISLIESASSNTVHRRLFWCLDLNLAPKSDSDQLVASQRSIHLLEQLFVSIISQSDRSVDQSRSDPSEA